MPEAVPFNTDDYYYDEYSGTWRPVGDTIVEIPQGPSNQRATYGEPDDFSSWLFSQMTPEQQDAMVAKGIASQEANPQGVQAPQLWYAKNGGDSAYVSPEINAISRAGQRVEDASQKNREELIRMEQLGERTRADNQRAVDQMGGLIDAQDPNNQAYVDRSAALAAALGQSRDTANSASNAALGTYRDELTGLSQFNSGLINNLGGVYGQLSSPLESGVSWDGDLVSQAAIADPAALAAQNEALGFLGGGMNGALDYQSAAAGAYADPRYVAMRDQGLEDLYGVSQGSKDVEVGEADPKAYASAMQALDQASELSNPAVTDQENFLYEQARQRWESEMRGVAQAKMSNLRRRGMAGGGAELTSGALANADISQKRVLSDLAASAGAVQRAGDMLKLKGSLATTLNDAGNALATGNANRQLQALGLYQQGAETAQQSSFDQEYKRGVAQDNASANNQQTRLQSGIAYGNQANTMQQQAFNRGMAADDMSRFNREGSLGVDMFNAEFNQAERDALWGRATDFTGLGLNASAQNSNNASNIFQGETSVANNNYVRDRDVVQGWDLASQRQWQGEQTQLDRRLGVQGQQIGINTDSRNFDSGVIGQNIANNQWTANGLIANDMAIAGQHASDKAALQTALTSIDAAEAAGKKGFLGLPIIGSSDYGLFSGLGASKPDYDQQRADARARLGRG